MRVYEMLYFTSHSVSFKACLQGNGGPQAVDEVTRLSIMLGGVTRHMLPHLPGVPHLHVNRS